MAAPAFKGVTRLLPPEEWVSREIENLRKVGRPNYEVGIASPKKDTIKAGIDAEPRYEDEMRKVIAEKRRAAGLKVVSLEEWFTYAKDIGAPRLVDGVVKRKAKVERFVFKWRDILLAHVKKLDEMPITTLEDRIAKMEANVRGLVSLKGKWKGAK